MSDNKPTKLPIKILLAAIFIAIISVLAVATYRNNFQTLVPEEAKNLVNPIPYSEATIKSLRPLYLEKCANCHGETGKGNGPDAAMYDPSPADFTDPKHMSAFADGELFYKITEGKKPMPSFKKRLSEEQRWQLVLFVRSFAEK